VVALFVIIKNAVLIVEKKLLVLMRRVTIKGVELDGELQPPIGKPNLGESHDKD
jgi:hypothetical protein